jgi:hypothetical protein
VADFAATFGLVNQAQRLFARQRSEGSVKLTATISLSLTAKADQYELKS